MLLRAVVPATCKKEVVAPVEDVCKLDITVAHGKYLPECEADLLTVNFIRRVLDVEKPDLVVLTGDQLHHDIPDSKSSIFKVVASLHMALATGVDVIRSSRQSSSERTQQ